LFQSLVTMQHAFVFARWLTVASRHAGRKNCGHCDETATSQLFSPSTSFQYCVRSVQSSLQDFLAWLRLYCLVPYSLTWPPRSCGLHVRQCPRTRLVLPHERYGTYLCNFECQMQIFFLCSFAPQYNVQQIDSWKRSGFLMI
jgi:hypothetical protein